MFGILWGLPNGAGWQEPSEPVEGDVLVTATTGERILERLVDRFRELRVRPG